jgi:hypothetical protein
MPGEGIHLGVIKDGPQNNECNSDGNHQGYRRANKKVD